MKALMALVTAGFLAIVAIASFLHITAAQRETRLKELRATAPQSYLAELKAANDARWESELQALDRPAYENLLADREAARRDRVFALRRDLKTVQSSDLDRQYGILTELSQLEPLDEEIKSKKTDVTKQIRVKALREDLKTIQSSDLDRLYVVLDELSKLEPLDKGIKSKHNDVAARTSSRDLERKQASDPVKFVTIEKFTWSKGGFGTVIIASFTIKNRLKWPVKDVRLRCEHTAGSGTVFDSNTEIVYERIEAGSIKRFENINMGFIHPQANRSGCEIEDVVVLS